MTHTPQMTVAIADGSQTPQLTVDIASIVGTAVLDATSNTFSGPILIADGVAQLDAGGGRGHNYYFSIVDTITDMRGSFPTRHFIHGARVDLTLADTSGHGKIDATLLGYSDSIYIDPTSTTAPANIYGFSLGVETDANVDADVLYGGASQAYQGGGGAIGVVAASRVDGDHFGTGVVAQLAGLSVGDMNASNGPATVAAGVYVEAQTAAYALYTNAGPAHVGDYMELPEITAPAAAAANTGRLFVRDNGSSKSQLCIRFPSGAIQVIATEP